MSTEPQLHPADPRLRRLALWLPLIAVGVGGGTIWAIERWLAGLTGTADEIHALLLAFVGLSSMLATIGLALGWSLWRQSSEIIREGRFPIAGMKTIRTVPIRRGEPARRIATLMRAVAVLAAGFGAALLMWMIWAVRTLG